MKNAPSGAFFLFVWCYQPQEYEMAATKKQTDLDRLEGIVDRFEALMDRVERLQQSTQTPRERAQRATQYWVDESELQERRAKMAAAKAAAISTGTTVEW